MVAPVTIMEVSLGRAGPKLWAQLLPPGIVINNQDYK